MVHPAVPCERHSRMFYRVPANLSSSENFLSCAQISLIMKKTFASVAILCVILLGVVALVLQRSTVSCEELTSRAAQDAETGRIPTLLNYVDRDGNMSDEFWLNCSWWSIKALLRLDGIKESDCGKGR